MLVDAIISALRFAVIVMGGWVFFIGLLLFVIADRLETPVFLWLSSTRTSPAGAESTAVGWRVRSYLADSTRYTRLVNAVYAISGLVRSAWPLASALDLTGKLILFLIFLTCVPYAGLPEVWRLYTNRTIEERWRAWAENDS